MPEPTTPTHAGPRWRDLAELLAPVRGRLAGAALLQGLAAAASLAPFVCVVEIAGELLRAGAPDDEVRAAATQAAVDEIVAPLPDGWDTAVGEGGAALPAASASASRSRGRFSRTPRSCCSTRRRRHWTPRTRRRSSARSRRSSPTGRSS